jgi:hypothetical protein
MGQDRGSCLSVWCIWSRCECSAGWSCWAIYGEAPSAGGAAGLRRAITLIARISPGSSGHPWPMSGAVEGRAHEAKDLVGEVWDACPAEKGGQVSRGERRPSAVGGLLADDLQRRRRAEVKLVEQEVIGVDGLQAERLKCGRCGSLSRSR